VVGIDGEGDTEYYSGKVPGPPLEPTDPLV
jgi:hypothetical protein